MNNLAAMPGDLIEFYGSDGNKEAEVVHSCGWQPRPNGGKVWTYETRSGNLVEYDRVFNVSKKQPAFEPERQVINSDKTSIAQVAISCINEGDIANLEVAVFLLKKRIKELKELSGDDALGQ